MVQCQAVWKRSLWRKKKFVHFEFQINIYALVEQKSLQLEWKVWTPGKKLYKLMKQKILQLNKNLHTWNKNILQAQEIIYWIEVCTCGSGTEIFTPQTKTCTPEAEIVLSTKKLIWAKEKNCFDKKKKLF